MAEEQDQGTDLEYLDRCYLETFSTAPGQEVLEDLVLSFFEVPLIDPSDQNPSTMLAFREGRRSVVLSIRAAMQRALSGGERPVYTQEDLIR